MEAIKSKVTKGLQVGSFISTCDNSGANIIQIISVINKKSKKGRRSGAGVSDLVVASVKSGKPDMRKKVVFAVVVRQRMDFKRPDGIRIKFEDNAAVVLKDDKGNPKGTIIKGSIAKEVAERWPAIAKIAKIVL